MNMADSGAWLALNRERVLEGWMQFLRFPSLGADPAHAADCLRCAEWLAHSLAEIGLEAQILPTRSRPVVYAECPGPGPTVLYYGHYDVQPPDPLDAWQSPPFAPELREGRVYARGAEDNKGQVWYVLKAIEMLRARGALRANIKVLIEGEEECGSGGLFAALPEWRERLRADVLMVCDTGMHRSGAAAIVMGLRGIVHLTAVLSGPNHDLHSGIHGGVAPNPAQGMAKLLATLHREDGSCAVAGFYDRVASPTPAERAAANAVPLDEGAYRADTGVPPAAGETGFTPPERLGFRPSLDINGVHSGYGGPGSKTIIPASAMAKITARLVPDQDPAECLEAVCAHLRAHTPAGLRLEIPERTAGGPGFRLPLNSPCAARAQSILREVTGRAPVFEWEGASIPVVSRLAEITGAQPLLVGFGRESDRIHAPNESFSLEQFEMGFKYAAAFLANL